MADSYHMASNGLRDLTLRFPDGRTATVTVDLPTYRSAVEENDQSVIDEIVKNYNVANEIQQQTEVTTQSKHQHVADNEECEDQSTGNGMEFNSTNRSSVKEKQKTKVAIHHVQDEADGAHCDNFVDESDDLSDNSSVEPTSDHNESSDSLSENKFKPGPLGTKFMEIGELIKVMGGPYTVLAEVPAGRKDGHYYVVNNKLNYERRSNGKRVEFWDDCGSWANGTSPIFTFIHKGGKLISIQNRSGIYCIEKQKQKKKVYEPLEPQPSGEELLIIKRLYNTLSASDKGLEQFRRKCTWIENIPSSMPELSVDIAIVEYVGTFPGRKPHGKSIVYKKPYIRTKPSVIRELKGQLKTQSVKTVMNGMNKSTKDDFSKQRNATQLRNFKYQQTKLSSNALSKADNKIINLAEMVKTHDLVYSVKHIKGLQDPVITLCNDQQITDIKRFCGTGRTVLGIDKTYNLGDFHVTPTVYQDLSVIRESNGHHPITFGPIFIHTNSSTKTLSSFFHDIADNLSEDELINLVIGSDDDNSFKVAIERCFPESTHTLCTRHLRQNTDTYLKDQVGYSKPVRQQITEAIYGDDGLTFTEDINTYNYRLDRLKETIQSLDSNAGGKTFLPYFNDKLVPVLKTFVIDPSNKGKLKRGWTNNKCESANHLLKSAAQWKHSDLPKFINLLNDIVTGEVIERCRAIRGMGDFELDSMFLHHKIDIDRWSSMSQECRDIREKMFLSDSGKLNINTTMSAKGSRTVKRTPTSGGKTRQVKRKLPRSSKTPNSKRVLLA
ncbi:uncharacterized protein LOC132722661 [Ruditapes philippinarum]|uniref:uncharacterized protein LOC132722661 n=1 Tax=Ruditapes philippinarum TaxID=129788 RepID=UPI00295BCB59|nr:uncharacterized protein LOC132722661 [Ruditapes philippinarum]